MTKEEIRHNNGVYLNESETFDENDIYAAMDEYAEQECIGFAEWLDGHEYTLVCTVNEVIGWTTINGDRTKYITTKELYQLYLKSKQLSQ